MCKIVIAVDFDGTIVTHGFPGIGKEIPGAVRTLKKLQKDYNCALILWTCRTGYTLAEALQWCTDRRLMFDAVNSNVDFVWGSTPKIFYDILIDDKAIDLSGTSDAEFDMLKWDDTFHAVLDRINKIEELRRIRKEDTFLRE